MDGTARELGIVRRTVVDHIASCLHSGNPQTVTAGLVLAAELTAAGVGVDAAVDARLAAIEAVPAFPRR